MRDVIVVALTAERIPAAFGTAIRKQIEVPQSAHFVTTGLSQGNPLSLSLDTYSIWAELAFVKLTNCGKLVA
jgi:hypothetical protein